MADPLQNWWPIARLDKWILEGPYSKTLEKNSLVIQNASASSAVLYQKNGTFSDCSLDFFLLNHLKDEAQVGEYTAAVVAGTMSLEDGLQLVARPER